jgi:hypothetical protein
MTYGVTPEGYVRKPVGVILAEIEALMITEFGPGVIQTPQSPFGQINGLFADLVAEIDERNLDLYQSYDPDQAEGLRLDSLARIRLVSRGVKNDAAFRKAITNEGQARIDVQDVEAALSGLDGVTFAKFYTEGELLTAGTVSVCVIGGSDEEIASTLRKYIVPGIGTYGNYRVMTEVEGKCRSFSVIRPIDIPVTLSVLIKSEVGNGNCPPPSAGAIVDVIVNGWSEQRANGKSITHYAIRTIVESQFPQIEVVQIVGERDGLVSSPNGVVSIGFIEIASLTTSNIEVTIT